MNTDVIIKQALVRGQLVGNLPAWLRFHPFVTIQTCTYQSFNSYKPQYWRTQVNTLQFISQETTFVFLTHL